MKLGLVSAGSVAVLGLLVACSVESSPAPGGDPVPGTPGADGGTAGGGGGAAAAAAAKVLGTSGTADLAEVFVDNAKRLPSDFAFNPGKPGEVWILNYGTSSVTVLQGVGQGGEVTGQHIKDPASSHFMAKPPQIAWGANGFWATCGDQNNGSRPENGNYFMGPALFTSDLTVFAKPTPDGLGSHYDMLHLTSFCRGIAHVQANEFFAFNSEVGALDWYDFAEDHGPGADDHADGKVRRYAVGEVAGVEGIPSHVVYDAQAKLVYAADTGNQRIVKLDPATGTPKTGLPRASMERIAENTLMQDSHVEEVVPPGTLLQPSGLHLADGVLYVGDRSDSVIYAFDPTNGAQLAKVVTGLPEGALTGIHVGPDGKLYAIDQAAQRFLRIDPK